MKDKLKRAAIRFVRVFIACFIAQIAAFPEADLFNVKRLEVAFFAALAASISKILRENGISLPI